MMEALWLMRVPTRRKCISSAVLGLLVFASSAGISHGQPKSIVIGIDGLGFGEEGMDVAATPWLDRLIGGTWMPGYQGAYTDEAFAGGVLGTPTEQVTVSGPGWSTMNTGVWIDRHGVNGNGGSFANGDFANNPPYLGTLKSALPGLLTSSYVNWGPIDSVIMEAIDNDGDPTNDLDFRGDYGNDDQVAAVVVASLASTVSPDVLFVAFDQVDGAGHSCGSSGLCYRQQIEHTDSLVGQILTAIADRPTFDSEDWQVVVTSDHGHRPSGGHGGQTDLERTIPFIVSSPFLNQGTLPALPQGVSQADVAPTVLDHFDVPLPAHYWGVSRASGAVSINPDLNGDGIVSGDGTGPFAEDDVTAFVSYWLLPNTAADPNPADFNLDGIANLQDWAILNRELPQMGRRVAQALAVPEPGVAALSGWGLLGAIVRLLRRRPLRARAK